MGKTHAIATIQNAIETIKKVTTDEDLRSQASDLSQDVKDGRPISDKRLKFFTGKYNRLVRNHKPEDHPNTPPKPYVSPISKMRSGDGFAPVDYIFVDPETDPLHMAFKQFRDENPDIDEKLKAASY
jgi:hypothetical protein